MSHFKNLVEETILAILTESDDAPLTRKNDETGKHRLLHTDRSMMTKIRKGMTDHEKKHMAGAYRDDTNIVHRKTGRTMASIHGKTVGQARKEIQAHIAKHHPVNTKPAHPVKHEGDTRSVVTASDDHANHLKKTFHGKDAKVRIMKRKEGNKVYIDSKSKEHHDTIKSKLDKMKHS
jgi:hypothetical protein